MKKRSFLVPVAAALTALVSVTASPVPANAKADVATVSIVPVTQTPVLPSDLLLERSDAKTQFAQHRSHSSHSSHRSHSSHYSSR